VSPLQQASAIREFVLQESDWHRAWTHSCLGEALGLCASVPERAEEAERMLVTSLEEMAANSRCPAEPREMARGRVVTYYESRGQAEKANGYRAGNAPASKTAP
jgi:hypothetical protein